MPKLHIRIPQSFSDCLAACDGLTNTYRNRCYDDFTAVEQVFTALDGRELAEGALDPAHAGKEAGLEPAPFGAFMLSVIAHRRFGLVEGLGDADPQGFFGLYRAPRLKNAALFMATTLPDHRIAPLWTGRSAEARRNLRLLAEHPDWAREVIGNVRRLTRP